MFAYILIFIVFLPVALLPIALYTFFSSSELNEMGIHLEDTQTTDALPDKHSSARCIYMSI